MFEPQIKTASDILERIENPEGFLQREYAVELMHGVENLMRVPTVLFRDDLPGSKWHKLDEQSRQNITDKFVRLSELAAEIHAKSFKDIPPRVHIPQTGIDRLFSLSEYTQWVAARLHKDDIRRLPLNVVARFSVLALEAFQALLPLFTNLELEGYKEQY